MLPTEGAAIQMAENMRPRGSAMYPTICRGEVDDKGAQLQRACWGRHASINAVIVALMGRCA